MIISASRRTDIPAFYSEWMLRRLKEGEVLVLYPRNSAKLGRVKLHPDNIDCIIFWTKNALPIIDKLDKIDALGFKYYFSFTITGYENDIERYLPDKQIITDTFLRLSDKIGANRVDWRFDPIMINSKYTMQWQLDTFGKMCRKLKGSTKRCIINFIKSYNYLPQIKELDTAIIKKLAEEISKIAAEYKIPIYNCTEARDLRDIGINFSSCIDKTKIEEICGYPINIKKDQGQPKTCRCVQSIDIGIYNTCAHRCSYCYAIASQKKLNYNLQIHNAESPLLSGIPLPDAEIIDRTAISCKSNQLNFAEF